MIFFNPLAFIRDSEISYFQQETTGKETGKPLK